MTQASIGLPQDFRKLAGFPRVYDGTINGSTPWPAIIPEEVDLRTLSTDKFHYVLGDLGNGYSLQINPGTLGSGASVQIPYYALPTSLASPNDVARIPDSQFIVDRVMAYIFESRSDPRFQEIEAKARERLLNMIEMSDMSKFSGYGGKTYVKNASRLQGFRWGK